MLSTPKSKGELFLASSLRDGLEDNDIRQVKTLLLSKEADPNVLIPTHGISPFHLVIGNESETFAEEVTKLFLRHGGNPNVRSADGMTPVHVAAAWGRVPVLELLLANGGDPLCLDDDGRSPFHYAFDGNFYDAVSMLGKYCGTSQDEEEDEPKYKLTLDKILINKGNVVAEYVTSEDSYCVESESSEICVKFKNEAEPKAMPTNLRNSSPTSVSSSADEFKLLNANNITVRRYQKRPVAPPPEANLDVGFSERSVEDERLLIGEIISRLSNTFTNDSLINEEGIVTSKKPSLNNKANIATKINKARSYLPLPKYHSHKLKSKETPRRKLVDTSIISKSPNFRIFADNKTPTPSKRKVLSPRSYTCKSRYWNNNAATPPLRSAKPEVRIKSASSTPKRKQYSGRLYEARELPKKPEKSINRASRKSKDVTPKILDKTYSKDRFGNFLAYSPDPEIDAREVDRKYLAKNIAIKLDDRLYDENQESDKYSDSQSDSDDHQTSVESSSNNVIRRLKPLRIYNNIKAEITSENENPRRCKIAASNSKIVSPRNLPREEKVNNFPISRPATPKSRHFEFQAKSEKNFETEERMKAILDSPGSSIPISACSLLGKENLNGDDNEDTKIWLEIEEACRNRCVTPPASVSLIIADNSPSSSHGSPTGTTFYSDYGSEDPNTSDFYEASMNSHFVLPNPRMMTSRSCSESFVSVEEEYTYEDAEEGVAFIERHLCVIPASTHDERNRAIDEGSLIDRLDELSLVSSVASLCSSPLGSLSRSLLNDNILRERLTALGEKPGPITKTTFNVYLKRLWRLERAQKSASKTAPTKSPKENQKQTNRIVFSSAIPDFLLPTDWTTKLQIYRSLEEQAFKEYATANPTRKYRGGISKTSFCYLLLDPRITRDLPRTGVQLSVEDRWKRFLDGVFYVGKGKAARPAAHLYDAFGVWSKRKNVNNISRKIRRILDIWQEGQGVVCLHVFSHTMLEEACSREATMIDALETTHLTNCYRGTYYGYTTTMNSQEKQSLGKYLLYKSMEIFMHEGERQLFPRNVLM